MRLHREGFTIIFVTTLVLALLNYGMQAWLGEGLVSQIFLGISLFFFIMVVQFFRNPSRTTPEGEGLIIAPADGKVVVIEEVEEPEYFKDKRKQISIFMSPVNVHVNRAPVSGKVLYYKYFKGKYLVAWHPKSSTEESKFCSDRLRVLWQDGSFVMPSLGWKSQGVVNTVLSNLEVESIFICP